MEKETRAKERVAVKQFAGMQDTAIGNLNLLRKLFSLVQVRLGDGTCTDVSIDTHWEFEKGGLVIYMSARYYPKLKTIYPENEWPNAGQLDQYITLHQNHRFYISVDGIRRSAEWTFLREMATNWFAVESFTNSLRDLQNQNVVRKEGKRFTDVFNEVIATNYYNPTTCSIDDIEIPAWVILTDYMTRVKRISPDAWVTVTTVMETVKQCLTNNKIRNRILGNPGIMLNAYGPLDMLVKLGGFTIVSGVQVRDIRFISEDVVTCDLLFYGWERQNGLAKVSLTLDTWKTIEFLSPVIDGVYIPPTTGYGLKEVSVSTS